MKKSALSKFNKISFALIIIFTLSITIIYVYFLAFYAQTKITSNAIETKSLNEVAKAGKYSNPRENDTKVVDISAKENLVLPIIMYHKTPMDFESQMKLLVDKGYTTVTMSEATEIITGRIKGPDKPVAISFDDGFSDQLKAMEILKKLNLKSTFYIIVGSKNSGWCIGAEKKAGNCGDAYMNWNDIKFIKSTGLVEIGSHTMDHSSLSSQNENVQRYEIFESKRIIEEKLGVKINSFAYPYGKYNDLTRRLVYEAGYTNAVTVNSSNMQIPNRVFELFRIRNANDLP
jgi:peptidoglycan/xylan/chitin deacetylase (PgdA/CDA1 family)